MNYAKPLGLILLTLILASCKAPSKATISPDDRLFINRFFNLRIEKPKDWHSMSNERMTEIDEGNVMNMNGRIAVLKRKEFTPQEQEAKKRTTRLFSFFVKDPERLDGFNANLMGIAEEIPFLARGSVKTGCQFLKIAGKNFARNGTPIEFTGDCNTRTINGRTFGMINGTVNLNGTKVTQRYLATLQKNHAIVLIQTFGTPEDEAALDKIAATISFKK